MVSDAQIHDVGHARAGSRTPGQPYAPTGTLTVCADYNTGTTGSPAYWKSTVTTRNTNFSAATLVPTITITKNGTGSSSGTC